MLARRAESQTVRETIVVHKGHRLPYSKGSMAQALSASGLTPERSFELARIVERRLANRGAEEIDTDALQALAEEVLGEEEGDGAVRRYRHWQGLHRLDRLRAGLDDVGAARA